MPKDKSLAAPVEGQVVEASMAGGSGGGMAGGLSGKAIEQAMADATMKALESGVTDPAEILKLKLAAREQVKAAHRAAVEKAAKGSE